MSNTKHKIEVITMAEGIDIDQKYEMKLWVLGTIFLAGIIIGAWLF